jgi:hypothetical protein
VLETQKQDGQGCGTSEMGVETDLRCSWCDEDGTVSDAMCAHMQGQAFNEESLERRQT